MIIFYKTIERWGSYNVVDFNTVMLEWNQLQCFFEQEPRRIEAFKNLKLEHTKCYFHRFPNLTKQFTALNKLHRSSISPPQHRAAWKCGSINFLLQTSQKTDRKQTYFPYLCSPPFRHRSATRRYRNPRQNASRRCRWSPRSLLLCSCRRRRICWARGGQRSRCASGSSARAGEVLQSDRFSWTQFGIEKTRNDLRNWFLLPQSTLNGWSHLLVFLRVGSKTRPSGHSFSSAIPSTHT